MPRYVTRPHYRKRRHKADDDQWDTDKGLIPELTVYEAEEPYEETGLLDHRGDKLYRDLRPYPCGFHTDIDPDDL
jgi:hypothetical protein